jgi:hypothetical protein
MKWPARVFLAAACARGYTVAESELNSGTSESTLTESQCSETVKKVQASGKYTEDAILPICSSEVKSSKCDFFAEALSLASTHTDFTSKVFCKDIAEAHTCSQMMDSLYESVSTKDLLFGECMRSQDGKSEQYCMKFKSLLGRAVKESDLDTMRACYMMQAYDEKEGPIDSKPSPAKTEVKKESKDEKAPSKPSSVKTELKKESKDEQAPSEPSSVKTEIKKESKEEKAPSKPSSVKKELKKESKHEQAPPKPSPVKTTVKKEPKHGNASSLALPKVNASHKVVTQQTKVSKAAKPVVKTSHAKTEETKSKVAKTIAKHEPSHSSTAAAVLSISHKESNAKTHSTGNATKKSKAKTNTTKTNTTNAKSKVANLAKMNASATKMNASATKAAEDKKYGGFLSGFVL